MFPQRENGVPFKLAWIGALAALLVMLPVSTRAEEKVHQPEIKSRLPELQKAVGKDWTVTALPDGYLVTYAPLVSFYPAISENSKLDSHQRAARGRVDHLRIKITFLDPPPVEKTDQFNAFWLAVHPAPGFFNCSAEDWEMCGDDSPASQGRALFRSTTLFTSNFAPDQLVSPRETVDVYEQTLDAMAPLFSSARHGNWD
jgi:hypothetical protein